MLRWASTGRYVLSKAYLEELLRHDSREVRIAAARTVISLVRNRRNRTIDLMHNLLHPVSGFVIFTNVS
jgi:hypothetical protein